jgi:arylsulfatase A-like enzyme
VNPVRGIALALVGFVAGCGGRGRGVQSSPDAGGGAATTSPAPAAPQESVVWDALGDRGRCVAEHLGPLFDLGDRSSDVALGSQDGVERVERDGASWARLSTRRLTLRFPMPNGVAAGAPLVVELRARSLGARAVTAWLNGKLLGDAPLDRVDRVTSTRPSTAGAFVAGTNELVLRLERRAKGDAALAEIDWIHVGTAEDGSAYVAPTRADAEMTATIGGVPRRAIALRGPATLRCSLPVTQGTQLRLAVGVLGSADADVEVRARRDREEQPDVLARAHAAGGPAARWEAVVVPIDPSRAVGGVGVVEVAIPGATHGSRVAIADLSATAPPSAPRTKIARSALLVVLGTTGPRSLELYGGGTQTPALAELAAKGVLFEAHRASSTWSGGSVASLLTGTGAPEHGVWDERARIASGLTTIAEAASQAGLATAMFTASPTTAGDFGFARGWQTYSWQGPQTPAAAVFDDAARWIAKHAEERFLVLVHARGGHPPWDVSAEQLKGLPPEGYTGPVEPHRAAEILARARRAPPAIRLTEADRTRAWALHRAALAASDAGLARLMAALRDTRREDDTAVYVTADVPARLDAAVPFGDGEPLDEAALALPLVARDPGLGQGLRVGAPTSPEDVGRTVLLSLGLSPPKTFRGIDLRDATPGRPLVAALGARTSTRLGPFVLRTDGWREEVCDLAADPTCAQDAMSTSPYALEALRRGAASVAVAPVPREIAYPSPATLAALRAWGR